MAARRILVAITGGIAAYKLPELVRQLVRAGHSVRCITTEAALHFVSPLVLQSLSGKPVRSRLFDPAEEDGIDHISRDELAQLVERFRGEG